ncbi:MAG: right-handed parallel beta-helix repeat-containing protein [Clostridia bacterium]|nr:right-handed parallel beta-helix repeat-containing protein [Clostridia bacterium]
MKIFNAYDYGVKPYTYCETALEKFLISIPHDEKEKTIVFQKGTYLIDATKLQKQMLYITNTAGDKEFSNDETPHLNRAPLWLDSLKNVTVEGSGAKFIIHGKSTNVVISNCENIKIQNLTIDTNNPEMHELKVIGKGAFFVDYKIDEQSDYVKENGKFYFVGHDYKRALTDCAKTSWWNAHFPADRPHFCQRMRHPLCDVFYIKEIGKRKIRAYCFSANKFKIGDKYYLYDVRREYAGIFVQDSKNITLNNVKQHFNYSLAFVAQNTENIILDKLDFTPDKGRVMCSVADFIQICMCRGKVTVKDSKFSGAGDDCMNVHGFHFRIADKNNEKITVRFMHPQSHGYNAFENGDKIEFIHPKTLLPKGSAKVLNSIMLNEYDIELTLDNTENAVIGEFIENVTACPKVDFVNNEVDRIITRGLLLTTRGKTNIENNHFYSTTMSGILLSDDADNWYESGICLDMTIKNNVFDYCGENGVLIKPENTKYESAVHKNITIEGNTFKKCEKACFDIKDTDNVVIKNNVIGECSEKLVTKNVTNITEDLD